MNYLASGSRPFVVVLESSEEWSAAAGVLRVLRPNLSDEAFLRDRDRLVAEGYRLIGVKADNAVVAVGSYVITPHPIYHRELLIHDMATLEHLQSKGYGSMLLAELDRIAYKSGCGRCFVHSRSAREGAHRFYRKNGYQEYSVGFIKSPSDGLSPAIEVIPK
jgi:GNAT superfamily N-acetyltransferase